MNNAEKKADKAARQGKVQHRDEFSQKSQTTKDTKTPPKSSPSKSKSNIKSAGPSSSDDKLKQHGDFEAGNPESRGMNNEEKRADKARREGRMPLDEGPGRANDVASSIEQGETIESGQKTKPTREKSEMSTGPGGAGQGEGMTPDVKGGGYERYEPYEGSAVVSDSVEPARGTATPINQVDEYGSEEPELGKERASTLESEASVPIEGDKSEEEPFGDEDKSKKSKTGLEEAQKASRPEKPARQSSRIKQTGTKRKMQEERESEGLLVSEDEERVKKASKKEVPN